VLATGGILAATDWIWEIPVAFGPLVVAAALLTGAATQETASAQSRPRGLAVVLLAAGWLAICAGGLVMLSEVKLDASHDAARRSDLDSAGRDARDAITLQPWAAEPRLQLGLVRERAGDLGGARESLEEAIERAPRDWRLWLVSARIETKAGRLARARRSLARARELNPRSPVLVSRSAAPAQPVPPR
jgi:Flp pilus assembly protein TadD